MTGTPTVASVQADIATLVTNSYQAGYAAGLIAAPSAAPIITFSIADYFPQPAPGTRLTKYLWIAGDPNMGNIHYATELWEFYVPSTAMGWDTGVGWVLDTYDRVGGAVPDGAWQRTSTSFYKVGAAGWLEWQDYVPPTGYVYMDAGYEFNWGAPGTALGAVTHSVQHFTGDGTGTFDVTLQSVTPKLILPTGTFSDVLKVYNTQTDGGGTTELNWWMTKGHHVCQVDYLNGPYAGVTKYAQDIPEW